MNWYKQAQQELEVLKPGEFNVPGNYFQIGHKSFLGKETDCKEWLWVWNKGELDIRPTGDDEVYHAKLWGPPELDMFKGRVSECDERISIAFPHGDRRPFPPQELINDLNVRFPNMQIFLFYR